MAVAWEEARPSPSINKGSGLLLISEQMISQQQASCRQKTQAGFAENGSRRLTGL
jgi:hypothetical protein